MPKKLRRYMVTRWIGYTKTYRAIVIAFDGLDAIAQGRAQAAELGLTAGRWTAAATKMTPQDLDKTSTPTTDTTP